jgi:hypothetical protein
MKVVCRPMESLDVAKLVVVDARPPHPEGEVVGYICECCDQCNETIHQIWHQEECPLAGRHGRTHYEDLSPTVPGTPTPELDPDIPITVVKMATNQGRRERTKGEVVSFLCRCGSLDEDLFEVVHDEDCPLAGRHGRAASLHRRARALSD